MGPGDEVALAPYVSPLVTAWLASEPQRRVRTAEGTLEFVDISGFTRLTELLAARGKAGAEEMTGYLDATFATLLAIARDAGGELVKWGGDAVLLWYTGAGHAARAVEAAWRMQRAMGRIGRLRTSAGAVRLAMSVGIHSGTFHFLAVGSLHRELLVTGPAATRTAHLEAVAEAGEIVISPETAAHLPAGVAGSPKADGLVVAAAPPTRPAPPQPPRPLGQPSRSLPAALAKFLVAAPVEGEHRQVSVAFVEFSGVADLLERHGEEGLASALDRALATVQEIAAAHRVTFWETDIAEDGGKVMLVAGAPSSTEDDAGSLLSAVRAIVDPATGAGLRLRAGVNCGRVFTGGFGPPFRRTYSAKGDAINLAARLMGRSAPGEVLASEAVLERSRVPFETEALEPFTVKGKSLPVRASRVLSARRGRKGHDRRGLPLLGREAELGALLDRLGDADRGQGACVELVGPPGIGKSRLVEEVEARAAGRRRVAVLCEEYSAATPFASARALVRQVLGLGDGDDPRLSGSVLAAEVDRSAPQVGPWLPLLAPVVGAEVAPTPEAGSLDERFRQQRQADALVELLSGALASPALLVVDDAQWIDDASAALLRHLAAAAPRRPWLLVVSRRDATRGPGLEQVPDAHRLDVGPLGGSAVHQLVRALTPDRPLVPHLREALAARAGGNPLFLLELVGAGLRSGFDVAMPDSVEGLFAAEVDRLAPGDRHLLRVASVLGTSVPEDVLLELTGDPARIEPLLDDFLTRDPGGTLRFRHNMLRDAAYEGLSYARRRELHARAGHALERRAGDDPDAVAALLAVHFAHAGDHQRAWRYARAAGRRAWAMSAADEAATSLERALESARSVRGVPAPELLEVAETLGDARCRLGQFAAGADAYRAARRWSSGPLDAARLQYKAALATDRAGRYPTTLQLLTRAERTLQGGGPPSGAALRQRAEIRAQYGLVRHRQGRGDEAVRLLRDAVALAEQAGAPDVLANSLLHLDIAELTAGVDGDGSHARRALEIQRQVGDNPWLEARALNQLGIRAYFAGRWPQAVAHYSASRAACERAGDRWTAAVESANIAEVLADQGHLGEAEPVLEEALDTYRAAGTRTFVADGTRLLGRLAARKGDAELGRQLLSVARGIYQSDGEALEVCLTDAMLAEAMLRAGQAEAAGELARRALANAAGLPGRHLVVPLAQRVLAIALRSQDLDADEARNALAESIAVARRHDARYELALSLQAVSDLWPGEVPDAELAERDALFLELGVLEGSRRVVPLPLPVAGV